MPEVPREERGRVSQVIADAIKGVSDVI